MEGNFARFKRKNSAKRSFNKVVFYASILSSLPATVQFSDVGDCPLGQPRQEHAGMPLMFLKLFTELPHEVALFFLGFGEERGRGDKQA
jgi:hypothetical protein